jgi:Alpha/beta hydrolase domain
MKTLAVLGIVIALAATAGGQGRGQAVPPANLPENPTPVALPEVSGPVTGPGTMYESVQSLAPGKGLSNFDYEAKEYFVSGTANGRPYKTRVVVRKPVSDAKFNGLVLAEPMHPSGSAHMFEFTSIYGMSTGYVAIDMLIGGMQQVIDHNPERYKDFKIEPPQNNEVIAQIGALVRSSRSSQGSGPMAGLRVRKMILAGTSATAGTLINYLPAHMVYRTPDMQRIFDGFMPTSNGSVIRQIDVPLIHVPTMLEVRGANITSRQDGDAPGDQYRVYEFPGMGHVDSRDNVRLIPNPCKYPTNQFPAQAFMSVALHHLFQWVDKGIVPPNADRIWKDRNEKNDGSPMVMDEHGNPRGGVRNTYVDVPTASHNVPNEAAAELIPNPSAYVAKGGMQAARQMCGLASYQVDLTKAELKQLYGSRQNYRSQVEKRLTELEKAGWSLPVYREMILADAAKVEF